MKNRRVLPGWVQAFTLIELLVAISIIGILAALILATLSKAKAKSRQTSCLNNLHQLGVGFSLYHDESGDLFPAPGSEATYGRHQEDWIWWQFNRGLENSAIARFVGHFNPNLFTCPDDVDARWLQTQGYLPTEPYRYSFGLTSFNLDADQNNPGMSTIITRAGKVYPFKAAWINHPSAKIMLVEEARQTNGVAGKNATGVIGGASPRWIPYGPVPNLISPRHNGKGDAAFADGHVERVLPSFGLSKSNTTPTL